MASGFFEYFARMNAQVRKPHLLASGLGPFSGQMIPRII